MPARPPQVQVFIPTFNRSGNLRRAVTSVLGQTFADIEVVVLDNHSSDDTPAVAAALMQADSRVTYLRRETNIGMIANFNAIATLATAPYFTMQADDDDYEPGFLQTAIDAFNAYPDIQFVACNALTRQGDTVIKSQLAAWRGGRYPPRAAVRRCLLGQYPLITNCLLRSAIREDFHFDPALGNVSDGFLMTRLFAKYAAFVSLAITGHWNNDGENASSLQKFDPVLIVDTVLREYELYADFMRGHRFIVDGPALLWLKKTLTILVAADRSSFALVLEKSRLRQSAGRGYIAVLQLAHALRVVRIFMSGLRLFRHMQVVLVSRSKRNATVTTEAKG